MKFWTKVINRGIDLFLKSNCPLCSRPTDTKICQFCRKSLQRCQFPPSYQGEQQQPPVLIWGEYTGILKQAIAVLKYENQPQIAHWLGQELAEAWLKSANCPTLKRAVVPIPLHPNRLKERGFNQAELIAESFCEVTGFPLYRQGLKRLRDTEKLFKLTPQEREQVLENVFQVDQSLARPQRQHLSVVLIDDIYTTGATVRSAIQALSHSGLTVGAIAAVASSRKS